MTKGPFKLRSGNTTPFKQMGSMMANLKGLVTKDMGESFRKGLTGEKEGLSLSKTKKGSLADGGKDLLTGGKTVKEVASKAPEKAPEKDAAKKAARKEKMSEIGKALVDTGTAISRSDLAGGRGGIIDNYDQIQKEKKSKALEDKSQSILNTYRELSNKQTMKDFDEALVEKNKTSASESHVASDMNPTIPKETAAEKYKNPSNDV